MVNDIRAQIKNGATPAVPARITPGHTTTSKGVAIREQTILKHKSADIENGTAFARTASRVGACHIIATENAVVSRDAAAVVVDGAAVGFATAAVGKGKVRQNERNICVHVKDTIASGNCDLVAGAIKNRVDRI